MLVSSASLPPRSTAPLGVVVAVATTDNSPPSTRRCPWGTASPPPSLPVLYVVRDLAGADPHLSFSALYAFRVADESRLVAEGL